MNSFIVSELASAGRVGPRCLLAHAEFEPQEPPLLHLFHAASNLSYRPDDQDQLKNLQHWTAVCQNSHVNELFLALARHIAHQSSTEDKNLLISAAQHPEQYQEKDEKLYWGLKYIVRGDLLLNDGSEITLDALGETLNFPPLPYLEDQPQPIDLE